LVVGRRNGDDLLAAGRVGAGDLLSGYEDANEDGHRGGNPDHRDLEEMVELIGCQLDSGTLEGEVHLRRRARLAEQAEVLQGGGFDASAGAVTQDQRYAGCGWRRLGNLTLLSFAGHGASPCGARDCAGAAQSKKEPNLMAPKLTRVF
jgi:hypothetical protein